MSFKKIFLQFNFQMFFLEIYNKFIEKIKTQQRING